tara:strand:+ start:883 stop:1110 length:228 start_codon:yes stop_codon:yes gene_type:complete
MAKTVLHITPETNPKDLVVLNKEQLIAVMQAASMAANSAAFVKDLLKAAGVPEYSFEHDNTVHQHLEKLTVLKKD